MQQRDANVQLLLRRHPVCGTCNGLGSYKIYTPWTGKYVRVKCEACPR